MTATYDFNRTRNQIITRALRIIGAVADGDDPTAQDLVEGAENCAVGGELLGRLRLPGEIGRAHV